MLPICNSNPLLPDINVHAEFDENWSKTTKLEAGNEALMDGRALKWFGGYNIISRHTQSGWV